MSYIRCTSNPEGLYIWSDGKRVTVTHNVKKPLSSGNNFTIPEKMFNGLCKRWAHNRTHASYRGSKAEEVHVYVKTGRPVPDRSPKTWFRSKAKTESLIRLSYKGDFVYLWRVTWSYVVDNATCDRRRHKRSSK